jgi:hypothetical protein
MEEVRLVRRDTDSVDIIGWCWFRRSGLICNGVGVSVRRFRRQRPEHVELVGGGWIWFASGHGDGPSGLAALAAVADAATGAEREVAIDGVADVALGLGNVGDAAEPGDATGA